MPKFTLADLTAEPTVFDLFGGEYKLRPLSRTVKKQFEQAEKKFVDYDGGDDDKDMALLAAAVETLLEPVGDAQPVSKAIVDAWKGEHLNVAQANELYRRVQEQAVARPT